MCFSGPTIPKPTAAPATATPSDPVVVAAVERERRRQQMLGGKTILTSGQGVTTPMPTGPKTVLGA